jgi:hypothetical protein
MLRDIEDTPTYKRLVQIGREEGLEQGLEQGQVLALRQSIEAMVQSRFPMFLKMIKYLVMQTTDLPQLQAMLLKAGTAHNSKEFKQYVLNLMESLGVEE